MCIFPHPVKWKKTDRNRNDYESKDGMSDNATNDKRRAWLTQRLADMGMDATNLSRAINRSPGFVRDFLTGRKLNMAADAWDAIEKQLGVMDIAKLEADEVIAAFEVLLQLHLGSATAAREGAQAILTIISDHQSLPAGVTRDAAIRMLVHQIILQLGRKAHPDNR